MQSKRKQLKTQDNKALHLSEDKSLKSAEDKDEQNTAET